MNDCEISIKSFILSILSNLPNASFYFLSQSNYNDLYKPQFVQPIKLYEIKINKINIFKNK